MIQIALYWGGMSCYAYSLFKGWMLIKKSLKSCFALLGNPKSC